MPPKEPPRLASQAFMERPSSFRMYEQRLERLYALHWHEFYELTYVVSGRGVNRVNGNAYPLKSGSLFLLTPADFHEIEPEPGGAMDIYNFIFSDDLLSAELRDAVFRENRFLSGNAAGAGELQGALAAEFLLIRRESQAEAVGSRLLVRGALERILILLARMADGAMAGAGEAGSRSATAGNRSAASRQEGVQRALTYLQHHFREPLTLESVARVANLSPKYFSECFHQGIGVPFQVYLQQLRLDFARSLLAAAQMSVTEACHVSGFHTLTHFERAFKRRFGISPRQARKG